MSRKNIILLIRGERALFRNLAVPGLDIADSKIRERAIKGLIGNLLGLWRDFNDSSNLDLASGLDEWWNSAEVKVIKYIYDFKEQVTLTQHRYKGVATFTTVGKSSPKPLTYHFGAQLEVELQLNKLAHDQLSESVKIPIGLPYMGQSNCLAQIHIKEK